MRWLWRHLMILVPGLLLMWACGSGSANKAAEEALSQTRQKVQQFESQIPADDTKGFELLEVCREKIVLANRRLIEGDTAEAIAIIEAINSDIAGFLGTIKGAPKQNIFEVYGLVRFASSDGVVTRLTKKHKLSAVKQFNVGGRSGLGIHLFKSTEIFLPAQAVVSVKAYDREERRLNCLLENGELLVKRKGKNGTIEIEMNKYTFIIDGECHAEFRYMPLVESIYVAVFDGQIRWTGDGSSGILYKYEGFHWRRNDPQLLQVPIIPEIVEPSHETKQGIDMATSTAKVRFGWRTNLFVANYQLQISDSSLFITRVYDNLKLDRAQAEVDLKRGTYYWRVRAITKEGVPGAFSKTLELHIGAFDPDQVATSKLNQKGNVLGPKITNLDYNLIGMTVIVSGKTKPGIKVNVNGVAAVQDDDGTFQAIVNFNRSGEHLLRIMALDPMTGGETIRDKKIKIAH